MGRKSVFETMPVTGRCLCFCAKVTSVCCLQVTLSCSQDDPVCVVHIINALYCFYTILPVCVASKNVFFHFVVCMR